MYYYKDECFFQHQDISYSRYKYIKGTYEHKHDFFEIAYVMDGKGYHYVDSECMEIKKGDYMILDTTVTHRYEGLLEIANVIFHPRIIDATYRDVGAAEELYRYSYYCERDSFGRELHYVYGLTKNKYDNDEIDWVNLNFF